MIRPFLILFATLTLLVACACGVFGPQERDDVIALANQERVDWNVALRHGKVSQAQYDQAIARLDKILAAARDESTRDLLLDIGLVGLGLLGGKAPAAARGIKQVINRRRQGKAT